VFVQDEPKPYDSIGLPASGFAAMSEFGEELMSLGFYNKTRDQCMEAKGYSKKAE